MNPMPWQIECALNRIEGDLVCQNCGDTIATGYGEGCGMSGPEDDATYWIVEHVCQS